MFHCSRGALVPEQVVDPVQGQQLVVRPTLDNETLVDHEDHVRPHDSGESVGDRDGRPALLSHLN